MPIQTSLLYFTSNAAPKKISGDEKLDIIYKIDIGNGKIYEHKYTLNGKGYAVDFSVNAVNLSDILASNQPITLNWKQDLPAQEGGIDDERFNTALYFMNNAKEEDDLSRDKDKEVETPLHWVSYKQKFFNTSLIAAKESFKSGAKLSVVTPTNNNAIVKTFSTQLQIPYNNNNAFNFPMHMFMGPNKYDELKK